MIRHKHHTKRMIGNIIRLALFIASMYWLVSCRKEKIEPAKPKDCGQCKIYPVFGKPIKEIDKSVSN